MSTHSHDSAHDSGHDSGHGSGHGDEVGAAECADFLERIVYLIDNELDEADCSVVRLHLESCNPCLEKYDLQRTVKSLVARSCSEAAPVELRERVRMRIREVQVRITEA